MGRLKNLDKDTLAPRQRELFDRIVGARGAVRGPFNAWLYSPELCDRVEALGKYLRFDSNISMTLKEVAVLVVARRFRSNYVWQAHERFALQHGVTQDVIDAIREGRVPDFHDTDQRLVYEYAHQMMTDSRVSDATWTAMVAILGEPRMVEFTAFIGNFAMVSLAVNTFAVDLPEGVTPAFV